MHGRVAVGSQILDRFADTNRTGMTQKISKNVKERTVPLDREGRVPEICPDWNMASSSLTPREGFLLSRIDGRTPCSNLYRIGGMPPDEIDAYLEKWHREGIIWFPAEEPSRGKGAQDRKPIASGSDEVSVQSPLEDSLPDELLGEIDPSLDIPELEQRKVLSFEYRSGDMAPHEILGVGSDADWGTLKRAYIKLSKEFHPDRYYGKNVGDYAERLGGIFQSITDAYQTLSVSIPKELKSLKDGVKATTIAVASPPPNPEEVEQKHRAEREKHRASRRAARREAMARVQSQRAFNPYRNQAEALLEEAERYIQAREWKEADRTLRLAKAFVRGDRPLKRRLDAIRNQLKQKSS